MFYVNIDSRRFVSPPNSNSLQRLPGGCSFPPPCPPPARSWEDLCEPSMPRPPQIQRPVLVHTEVVETIFAFVHKDYTPVDVTDMTFVLAVDNTFDHRDQLIAFSEDFTILDAANGIVSFNIDCSSVKFQKVLQQHVPPSQIMMQVVYYAPGSAQGRAFLQDRGIQLKPRIYAWEGAPDPASPEYYTKAQITSLLKHYVPVGSDSSTCTVINGQGDPDPELGNPGDLYIDTVAHKVWLKGQTQWTFFGYITESSQGLYYDILSDSITK